jgi:transposase
MWVANQDLPRSAGHPFYAALEGLLTESGFDAFVEGLCAPHYAKKQGRPSIPPGVYFRMLFVGYFEGSTPSGGLLGGAKTVCRYGTSSVSSPRSALPTTRR